MILPLNKNNVVMILGNTVKSVHVNGLIILNVFQTL